jgi:hypothetical protein
VADLIIYILKNGENSPRVMNFSCNFLFFAKKICKKKEKKGQVAKSHYTKKH